MQNKSYKGTLSERVLDKNGKKIGFIDRIISLPNQTQERELWFVVMKKLYLTPAPRILFRADQIFKIDKRILFLDVELEDFEHQYSKAIEARRRLVKNSEELKTKKIIRDSDVIAFEWNELA